MHAEISKLTNEEVELKFNDEDISILYILQHYLLKEKNVDFAGVIVKHPLIKDFLVKITSKEPPLIILEKSINAAKEFGVSFSDSIESICKRENK
ncbi:MAG: hypothetical protein MRJ93_02270 [Nitrososphaeraceae archaeon]|nr:hypothetical protein [Nitrososphaeraceae archaeon]